MFIALFGSGSLSAANLANNASFEEMGDSPYTAAGWSGTYERMEGSNAVDGKACIRCLNKPENKVPYCDAETVFSVSGGAPFEIAGKSSGREAFLFLIFYNRNGKKLETQQKYLPYAKEWTSFLFRGTIPEEAVKCTLILRSFQKTEGTLFDKIEFESRFPGKTSCRVKGIAIELPPAPSDAEKTAAEELAHYLGRALKNSLKIGGNEIRTIRLAEKSPELKEEEWIIRSCGDMLVIRGGGRRGTLHGVYNFLEWHIGIHWWTPQEEFVPFPRDIVLDALDQRFIPGMFYRDIFRSGEFPDNGRFAARNRLNRDGDKPISSAYGGAFSYGAPYHCHTFDRYIPAGTYLKSHPEFFSLRNGKRLGGQYTGQLCLTNSELKKLFLGKLLENIRNDAYRASRKGVPAPRLYDVSINDNWNSCQCPSCTAEVKKYGESGLLLQFVNELAEKIATQYPNVSLTTLAYFHTEEPPHGIRPAENVIVRFCDTKTNQARGILAPENAEFRKLLEKWAQITDKIFLWDYAVSYNFPALPYPSEMTYGELHRFYAENHVKGIFWEHEFPQSSDLYAMKVWLEAKLMENPYADFVKLRKTFLDGYYGNAGKYIGQYRDLLCRAAARSSLRIDWFALADRFEYVDLDTLLQAHRTMDQAEMAVEGNPELLNRVRRARVGLDTLTGRRIRHYMQEWNEGGNSFASFPVKRRDLITRLKTSWLPEGKKYAEPEKITEGIEQEINALEFLPVAYRPPEKFRNRKYFDFTPEDFKISTAPGLLLGADPEAENGYAVKIDAEKSHYFKPPMEMGLYDTKRAEKLITFILPEIPRDGKYHWILAGKAAVNPVCYVYLTRSWQVQAKLASIGKTSSPVEVWTRIKFIGPYFQTGKEGKSHIWIDRVTLVEAE